jgi:hypothetical protein
MQALADNVPPEDADLSPPDEDRLVSREAQWEILSQPAGSVEEGTRGQRIAEWLQGVRSGEIVDLDGKSVITSGEINLALWVRMGVEVCIGLQPRQLCRRWYLDRHRSLGQNEKVGT